MQDALQRTEKWMGRLHQAHTGQPLPRCTLRVKEDMPQQRDGTSCGIFMACAGLAIIRAMRDGADVLHPRLDFAHTHMKWLRVHLVDRYCNAIPPLAMPR